ncbi:MAG: MgtC/SapB family protein, partial [Hymenobacteraceae bacterium]|nr:MgtC/SapB family protein [Hymenobacteraceae bacterium]MDX5396907.1 MgtC/SapB family protein [Hymenobacteraceae bacterium]MDX5444272.1 MgtC/SapB family protein [Hymenobacteraceae bacterium]MDX5512981.1 MgtC/SapB family protein [Hymenobacteraceae bacterium]
KLMGNNNLDLTTGWKMILIASLSNLMFKGGIVAMLGHRSLLYKIAFVFGLAVAGGLAVLFLWPEDWVL